MIKTYIFLPKRTDLSDEQFRRHWRDVHAPLSLQVRAIRGYIQAHRLAASSSYFGQVPYCGIAEVWFDDLSTATDLPNNPEYLDGLHLDEPNFLDQSGLAAISTEEHVVVAGDGDPAELGGVKSMFLVERKRGMSVADFRSYWKEQHAPLVIGTPGLRRYVQSHTALETYDDGDPVFDGVAELWWEDLDAFDRSLKSSEFTERQAPDLPNFARPGMALLAEPLRII